MTTFSQSYMKGSDEDIPTSTELDEQGIAVDFQPGDLLVLSYTTNAQSSPTAYTPNGDGSAAPGGSAQFPNITLPQ